MDIDFAFLQFFYWNFGNVPTVGIDFRNVPTVGIDFRNVPTVGIVNIHIYR
jgi:hypothetical protein